MAAQGDPWTQGSPLDAVIWRARGLVRSHEPVVATGWRRLDDALPGGGWPNCCCRATVSVNCRC